MPQLQDATGAMLQGGRTIHRWLANLAHFNWSNKFRRREHILTHRIHSAGIYANIAGILMVNVTIYSIHGSYG